MSSASVLGKRSNPGFLTRFTEIQKIGAIIKTAFEKLVEYLKNREDVDPGEYYAKVLFTYQQNFLMFSDNEDYNMVYNSIMDFLSALWEFYKKYDLGSVEDDFNKNSLYIKIATNSEVLEDVFDLAQIYTDVILLFPFSFEEASYKQDIIELDIFFREAANKILLIRDIKTKDIKYEDVTK